MSKCFSDPAVNRTGLFQALDVLHSRMDSTSRNRPMGWNSRLPLTLCDLCALLHKTGSYIVHLGGLGELKDIMYDNDQHGVCPAISIIIVLFIYHNIFQINPRSNLASLKSILKSTARVNILRYKLDPITPVHKIILSVSIVHRIVFMIPQGADQPFKIKPLPPL